MTARLRRWCALALAPIAAVAIVGVPSTPADAEPTKPPTAEEEGDDPLLREVLESTGRRYLEAKTALAKSKKRQLQLTLQITQAEARRDALLPQVRKVASESYRTGRLNGVAFLLRSLDSSSFLDRAATLNELNLLNSQKLKAYSDSLRAVERAKQVLDLEVKEEQKQFTVMSKQQREAERALALVGGNGLTQGFVLAKSPVAKAAPRTSDGDLPRESCSKNDPTTSGCVTPRTLHMYREVRKAGFKRFVGCHRSGGPFEHPKGRACDWSLKSRGFADAYNKDMRMYGNNLMAFLVRNADALGVLYVIWYRKIWFPATGWRPYQGDSPHTDHVHVSML
jgi:peptidoglycan DL-endopeptidase CwlO